jgi:hypothetical protein
VYERHAPCEVASNPAPVEEVLGEARLLEGEARSDEVSRCLLRTTSTVDCSEGHNPAEHRCVLGEEGPGGVGTRGDSEGLVMVPYMAVHFEGAGADA